MDEGQRALVSWVARVTARLAHKFADRQAILFRFGVDEEGWEAREIACLALLAEARERGEAEVAFEFAAAFEAAREELYGRAPTMTPEEVARQMSSGSFGETLATLARATPARAVPRAPAPDGPIDMTLKSPTTAKPRPGEGA